MITAKKNIFLSNQVSWLLYILPIAIVTGPFLADLIISLIGLYFLIASIFYILYDYYKNKFTIIFLIFYAYILIRSLLSENIALSLESSLFYFRFLLFSLGFFFLLSNNEKLLSKLTLSFIITVSFVLFDAFLQFFVGSNVFLMERPLFEDVERISGLFGDELILGSYLSRIFPILIGLILISNYSKKNKIFMLFFFMIGIDLLCFLSGERASIAYMTLSSLIMLSCLSKLKLVRLVAVIISLTLGVLIVYNNPFIKERTVDRTINQIGLGNSSEELHVFSAHHESHYKVAIMMFKDNLIFGQGPKMFRDLCLDEPYSLIENGCINHPHNTYLQLLAETGLVGFLIIFSIFLYLSYILLRQFLSIWIPNSKPFISDFLVCIICSMYITLWPVIPNGSFFTNWLCVVYFLPIGIYLFETNKKIIK